LPFSPGRCSSSQQWLFFPTIAVLPGNGCSSQPLLFFPAMAVLFPDK